MLVIRVHPRLSMVLSQEPFGCLNSLLCVGGFKTQSCGERRWTLFIMQSHKGGVGAKFTNSELAKIENKTSYDFVYQVGSW